MKQKIEADLKRSMKAGERLRVMTLRGVLAEITRLEKELRRPPDDIEIARVIKRERARRDEARGFALKAGRAELVTQNEVEARVLDEYLPAAAGADELKQAIAEQIAAGARDIGTLMKALKSRFGAAMDGKLASELARNALAEATAPGGQGR
jgi:uncharacterized protein YqeY